VGTVIVGQENYECFTIASMIIMCSKIRGQNHSDLMISRMKVKRLDGVHARLLEGVARVGTVTFDGINF